MAKQEKQTVFNQVKYTRKDSMPVKETQDLLAENREKVALAIGRQLMNRNLISFKVEDMPGTNPGERSVTIKGTVIACTTQKD